MITIEEKSMIIDKHIEELNYLYSALLRDIDRIQEGMEDPDLTIEECNAILPNIQAKIDALNIEKQALTSI